MCVGRSFVDDLWFCGVDNDLNTYEINKRATQSPFEGKGTFFLLEVLGSRTRCLFGS